MTSRCIKALNELDAISDKVFFKYSQNRFQSEIEGRIKASKNKVERSFDQNLPSKTRKRVGSSSSFNGQNTSELNSTTKARATKSAANPKTLISQYKERKERVKTTGCCRKISNKTTSRKEKEQAHEMKDKSDLKCKEIPSVYGKHSQDEGKSNPDNWFNFEDGVKMGTIDSFVCDERKTKALCYTLDKNEAKPVPKLLHHRLQVRIGQNGVVRNTDVGVKEKDLEDCGNTKKIPLSWEDQLDCENACIKSPRQPSSQQTEDKGLCETHPVIFNPQERTSTLSSVYDMNDNTAAYRMYLDRRLLVGDRGNLVCGGKCITSVEIEDARDDIEETKELQMINSSLKAYVVDVDRTDMNTTILDIENIYPRRSTASKSSSMWNPENEVVENPADLNESVESNQDIPRGKDSERTENITKRVSFKDEMNRTGQNNKTIAQVNVRTSQPKERPKSSKERSEITIKPRGKPKRPYTAPPCIKRVTVDEHFEREIERHFRLTPICVPTSEFVSSDQEDNSSKEEKPFEDNLEDNLTPKNDNEVYRNDRDLSEGQPAMRISVACKSAPTVRRASRTEEAEPISRSFSSMCSRTNKNKYVPPKPVAVLADSSMELPPNLPPAQALVELRKKIREDLAKETADLQLDIQQLYLKHHSCS